jgi:NAD(P) transhydrogenase subunit alpha
VLIIGAGVAGLQAIGTARRLGAVVTGYDLRPAVKEQVQSLGARFLELPLEAKDAQDAGGYARQQDEAFYARQRELLGNAIAESDVVITTAVVPGSKAPVLVTKEMVSGMAPGSVIVDLAAERGGNCELTQPGRKVIEHGVSIIGSINISSSLPNHASQMYAKNLTTFLAHLVKDGAIRVDLTDQITRETLLTHNGEIVNERVRKFYQMPALVDQLI